MLIARFLKSTPYSIFQIGPLHAEEICEALKLARSNVSTALKELQGYNIVRRTHVVGDRRDHFVAELDLWDMFMAIVAERKRREIDPIVSRLNELQRTNEGSAKCTRACIPSYRTHA